MYSQNFKHLKDMNLLFYEQFGYQLNDCTENELHVFYNHLTKTQIVSDISTCL